MKTPSFWKQKTFFSTLLMPLGWLYGGITALRIRFSKPYHAACPVFCVGNLTAGGTGKTPVSIALAEILKSMGKHPFFISRGYGGKLTGVLVEPEKHTPFEVGDEPLLLAQTAPVVINPNRAEAAKLALQNGADCLIMDDGFQNPTLYKDFSFLVFDGAYGIGNGRILPAGPLRESFESGIKRAQVFIILGHDLQNLAQRTSLPVLKGEIVSDLQQKATKSVLAFAGIGHPEKFYRSLEECGFQVLQKYDFPDHHFYTASELNALIMEAQNLKCEIFTTSKDYVKIPQNLKSYFKVLDIKVRWENENAVRQMLENILKG